MLCWEILSSCRIARKFPKLSYYAMLSLASSKQGLVKYIHAMMKIFLSLWTYVFLNKTTKSMNHLGGMGLDWWFLVEWLHKAHGYGLPCVSHLWYATQEQRDFRGQVLRSL
jgi:hypothetical protein